MKKYKLKDVYDVETTIGYFDTMEEVTEACENRTDETDGEWYAKLLTLDETTQLYR